MLTVGVRTRYCSPDAISTCQGPCNFNVRLVVVDSAGSLFDKPEHLTTADSGFREAFRVWPNARTSSRR